MSEISVFNRITGPNIFNLNAPDEYGCSIASYRLGLTTLQLILHGVDSANPEYLIFGSPIYYEGPTTWKGASFFLGSLEETTVILDKAGTTKGVDSQQKQMFIEQLLLFKTRVSGTNFEVKIIAIDALLSNKPITFSKVE